jgi:putative toxin-antitoxin system antitoxin component (TIGR02293 family)
VGAEVDDVLAEAIAVLGSEVPARAWLARPQRGVDGRTPVELLVTAEGRAEVELLLNRLDAGTYV